MSQNIVFLPGTLCDERIFTHQMPIFPQHQVISLRVQTTIDEMVKSVEAVSFEKFTLIGFSMGGHIAQEFALKHPERVEKLIIIACSSEGYPVEEKKIVQGSLALIEKSKFTGITDKRLKDYLYPTSYENQEIKDLIQSMAGIDAKEVYLRQTKATLERRNLKADLKNLNLPVLFIAGAQDQIVPLESIRRSAENISGALLVEVEECGHFVPLEQATELNQTLEEFLS